MERYRGVHGARNVEAIAAALEESGATILRRPDPSIAPFEFTVLTPDKEQLELVCYAFTANKYRQGGRANDEHRMQVKYGSEFDRYHDLFIDRTGRRITLMIGWHQEEGIFVAVDPQMHNPTWFSRSIEFKDEHVTAVQKKGWEGWERERKDGRRKIAMPHDNFTTEALLGFKPKNFLTYVALERIASGADAGERLLMIDRIQKGVGTAKHPMELALGLSSKQILDLIGQSFRLLVAVRGSVAEQHLLEQLGTTRGIADVRRLDEDGQPDFIVSYRARDFRVECKNVLRRLSADRIPRVDFQKTRAAKNNPCSRYYSPEQFEVMAACLHPVSEKWEYQFATVASLPKHPHCVGRVSSRVIVNETFRPDIRTVFDELYDRGRS